MFTIGVVTGAHGIKGDCKVFPLTDEITRFENLLSVNIEQSGKIKQYEIEKVWYHKKYVCLKLNGINTMNDALAIKGGYIKIEDDFAITLNEDEYFVRDLYGMDVADDTGQLLGKITDVFETGANDVYVINETLLIPAIKQCILNVDVQNKKMIVHLLEGLV